MSSRTQLIGIIFSPLINLVHNKLHISFFGIFFIVMIIFTIDAYNTPKWSLKKLNKKSALEKFTAIGIRIIMPIICMIILWCAISTQFLDPIKWDEDLFIEMKEEGVSNSKWFLVYLGACIFGAYRVFQNGILLPYKKKKAGDKKAKIDIMSVVYFAMLSIFAITSLFIVLGVIKT